MRFVFEAFQFHSMEYVQKSFWPIVQAYINVPIYLSLIHKIDMNIDLGKIANFYNTILVRGLKLLLRDSIWQWLVSSSIF